jgi:predicted XRE-type DNA-binding protein
MRKTPTRTKQISDDTADSGSGNFWIEMGRSPEEAEIMTAKVRLTVRIHNRIKELGLTQVKAARRLRISQPDVSKLMRGIHTAFSLDKLMSLLRSLDLATDIEIRPKRRKAPNLRVVEAA